MNGWMERWMEQLINGWMVEWIDGTMDGTIDRWMRTIEVEMNG